MKQGSKAEHDAQETRLIKQNRNWPDVTTCDKKTNHRDSGHSVNCSQENNSSKPRRSEVANENQNGTKLKCKNNKNAQDFKKSEF